MYSTERAISSVSGLVRRYSLLLFCGLQSSLVHAQVGYAYPVYGNPYRNYEFLNNSFTYGANGVLSMVGRSNRYVYDRAQRATTFLDNFAAQRDNANEKSVPLLQLVNFVDEAVEVMNAALESEGVGDPRGSTTTKHDNVVIDRDDLSLSSFVPKNSEAVLIKSKPTMDPGTSEFFDKLVVSGFDAALTLLDAQEVSRKAKLKQNIYNQLQNGTLTEDQLNEAINQYTSSKKSEQTSALSADGPSFFDAQKARLSAERQEFIHKAKQQTQQKRSSADTRIRTRRLSTQNNTQSTNGGGSGSYFFVPNYSPYPPPNVDGFALGSNNNWSTSYSPYYAYQQPIIYSYPDYRYSPSGNYDFKISPDYSRASYAPMGPGAAPVAEAAAKTLNRGIAFGQQLAAEGVNLATGNTGPPGMPGGNLVSTAQAVIEAGSALLNVIPVEEVANASMRLQDSGYLRSRGTDPIAPLRVDKQLLLPPPGVGQPKVTCHRQGMTCCVSEAAVKEWRKHPVYLNYREKPACQGLFSTIHNAVCATTAYADEYCGLQTVETKLGKIHRNLLVVPGGKVNNAICECHEQPGKINPREYKGFATWEFSAEVVEKQQEKLAQSERVVNEVMNTLQWKDKLQKIAANVPYSNE